MPGPLNYTTTIPVNRTVAEMQDKLAKAGASTVSTVYVKGEPTGLHFTLPTDFGDRDFTMPVNVDGVHAVLMEWEQSGRLKRVAKGTYTTREHAARVAWRVVKDWLEAQLAMIEANMAKIDEVMLPYMLTANGGTVIEAYRTNGATQAQLSS